MSQRSAIIVRMNHSAASDTARIAQEYRGEQFPRNLYHDDNYQKGDEQATIIRDYDIASLLNLLIETSALADRLYDIMERQEDLINRQSSAITRLETIIDVMEKQRDRETLYHAENTAKYIQ